MSDADTEITTNNLDKSEEAFDQFQANISDENEYITLSDILPSETTTEQNLPSMLDDMLRTEQLSPDYLPSLPLNGNMNTENDSNTAVSPNLPEHSSASHPVKPKGKRGRKPKKNNLSTSIEETNVDIMPTHTPTTTTSRGRVSKKRINYKLMQSGEDLKVTSQGKEERTKNVKRKNNKKSAKPARSESDLTKFPKKRGRKKKIQPEETKDLGDSEMDLEEPLHDSLILDNDDDDDDGDIALSKLKKSFDKNDSIVNSEKLSSDQIDPMLDSSGFTKDENDRTSHIAQPILTDFQCNVDNIIAETPNVVVESVFDLNPKLQCVNNSDESHETSKINETSSELNKDQPEKIEKSVEPSSLLIEQDQEEISLLLEDSTKRQSRRNVKRKKYEVDSDEDPFANVELSDDDGNPKRKKKGYGYYSDDEYVPGKLTKGRKKSFSEADESDEEDLDEIEEFEDQKKRKRTSKKSDNTIQNKSPGKRGRPRRTSSKGEFSGSLPNSTTDENTTENQSIIFDDLIKSKEFTPGNKAFEKFLAQRMKCTDLKIQKVSKEVSASKNVAPLEIPTIDSANIKKYLETSSQTNVIPTKTASVQTSSSYGIKMKQNMVLSSQQSENACEFLCNLLKTTSELGILMTEKSEEFIEKKININYVKDTTKIDYCIKKAFLLFKLAKDNLTTMEENLEKQYQEFLSKNNLLEAIEVDKQIVPKAPETNSDSDCEIVAVEKPNSKAKFNPKTVFLNKELSIKIAKKEKKIVKTPPPNKQLNVKGRHAVWINDSVMVKKVKTTQSFLAQDSRNKKPPDSIYVTDTMVKNFFDDYYRKQAALICQPFISPQWVHWNKRIEIACNYFIVNKNKEADASCSTEELFEVAQTTENDNEKFDFVNATIHNYMETSPKRLFSLCFNVLQQYIIAPTLKTNPTDVNPSKRLYCDLGHEKFFKDFKVSNSAGFSNVKDILPLKTICCNKVIEMLPWQSPRSKIILLKNNECGQLQFKYDVSQKTRTYNAKPLLNICINFIQGQIIYVKSNKQIDSIFTKQPELKPQISLLTMALNRLKYLIFKDSDVSLMPNREHELNISQPSNKLYDSNLQLKMEPKTLLKICLETLNIYLNVEETGRLASNRLKFLIFKDSDVSFTPNRDHELDISQPSNKLYESNLQFKVEPKTLLKICLETLKIYLNVEETCDIHETSLNIMTIDNVNTVSEEVFLNMEEVSNDSYDDNDESYCDNEDIVNEDFDTRSNENLVEENNWVSKLKLKELQSCLVSNNNSANCNSTLNEEIENPLGGFNVLHIKQETAEEHTDYDNTMIKIKNEPEEHPTEMVHIPDNIRDDMSNFVTKGELPEYTDDPIVRGNSVNLDKIGNFDADSFYQFVRNNKMMTHDATYNDEDDPIFSQSGLRVRRQHRPDSDVENEDSNHDDMSLLIPTISEPVNSIIAKGNLMESTSDDENTEKSVRKKDLRKKCKTKKTNINRNAIEKEKQNKAKENPINDEISILTRRMKDKIKKKEKCDESSDENADLNLPKQRKNQNVSKERLSKENPTLDKNRFNLRSDNTTDCEIQCNNVDSTEQMEEKDKDQADDFEHSSFTGFNTEDQTKIATYHKMLSSIYNKILPVSKHCANQSDSNNFQQTTSERSLSPLIITNGPAEMLECVPTIPMFDNAAIDSKIKTQMTQNKSEWEETIATHVKKSERKPLFTERYGWSCYPINGKDLKLYQMPYVVLDKLPEAFVETYFQYQQISNRTEDDAELDRLTNLQTLNRPLSIKEGKTQDRMRESQKVQRSQRKSNNASEANSPTYSDNFNEFAPSDEESVNINDEQPPPAPHQTADNCLAKNLLMNDENDSENDTPLSEVKKEQSDSTSKEKKTITSTMKQGVVKVYKNPKDLILTADKMMKQELELLHAPTYIDDEVKESKYTPTKESTSKHKEKHTTRSSVKRNQAKSDDSSSEEEKQWVSTKEKLLKLMEKKNQDNPSHEDAKRAKLVTEYIEKREDPITASKRKRGRKLRQRVSKKFLERQKQMRVLNKELFGEAAGHVKRSISSYSRGRRNIRKVIDKQSLRKSTVIANMEEFERKRRLSMKQNRLRELLGYEEGVNVLVINDEVCLEYDFEDLQPIVTVHPFFTKVMKAHQYEGVKFMWDACFESLEFVGMQDSGGGCILAHCMGLGKTLQVLALLHTVLTHPRVGMQRVLVCCPLSTVLNWVDEIHKWMGPVTNQIKVFELSKLKKTYERAYQLEDWYNNGGIFIIGYELFRSLSTLDAELDNIRPTIVNKIRSALLDPGPDIIVCDEGHLLKNDASVLAIAMSRVRTKRRIVLTGTPMQNNLREYYCMVNFVKPNLLGTYSEFSNRFENPIMNGQHRDSQEEDIKLMKARTHILHKVLEGCLQRQEASVLYPYLPKKYEYTVFISLTKCQADMYRHYLKTYTNSVGKNSILRDYNMLQKIWSHPRVLHNFQTKRNEMRPIKEERLEDDLANEELNAEDHKPPDTDVWWLQHLDGGNMLDVLESSIKFVTVFKILEESVALNDKLLIFSTSLYTMNALEHFLKLIKNWSLGQEYYRLDGSVPPEVRQKWCREFNAENNYKTKLFLISTRAGSLGLNMTAANRVIILDTSWNPAHDIQSIFRVYRFGQKKDCFIYRLVAMGTMEQKIYERAVTKQAVSCRVVDEQQIDRHYNMAELTELYRFDAEGAAVAAGVAAGVRDVVLLRVARDVALHAVHEHDSLLRDTREQDLPEHERAAAWSQFQEERRQLHATMDIVAVPKVKSAPSKRPHGHDYAKDPTGLPGPSASAAVDPEYDPYEPKQKKGRKSSTISCDIPIQNVVNDNTNSTPRAEAAPSVVPDAPMAEHDNDIFTKIREALSKYNFSASDAANPSEVAKLVSNIISNANVNVNVFPPISFSVKQLPQTTVNTVVEQVLPTTPHVDTVVRQTSANMNTVDPPPLKYYTEAPPPLTNMNTVTPTPLTNMNTVTPPPLTNMNTVAPPPLINMNTVTPPPLTNIKTVAPPPLTNMNTVDPPPLTNIESVDSETRKLRRWKSIQLKVTSEPKTRGRRRKVLKDKTEPEESLLPVEVPPAHTAYTNRQPTPARSANGRIKRQAAIVATNMMNNDIIDLDEDDDARNVDDTDYVPDDDNDVPEVSPAPSTSTNVEPVAGDTSIVLSDDDADLNTQSNKMYPLHTSLLTNKNFIKIVAHTYLKGNPMLDEDAATLAAEYSTSKAMKEVQLTGKSIDSGPIYDIAVQVLGMEVLKKLHDADSMTKSKKSKTTPKTGKSAPLTVKEETVEPSVEQTMKKNEVRKPVKKPREPRKLTVDVQIANSPIVMASQANDAANVVPVGLFKRTVIGGNTYDAPSAADECILPDDDDDHMPSAVRLPPPSAGPPALPAAPAPVPAAAAAAAAATGPTLTQILEKKKRKPTFNPQVRNMVGLRTVKAADIPKNVPLKRIEKMPSKDSTICLDSDDDEVTVDGGPPLANPPAAKVVPISLQVANSTQMDMSSQIIVPNLVRKVTSATGIPTTQVLNVVHQPATSNPASLNAIQKKSQFIVLPASEVNKSGVTTIQIPNTLIHNQNVLIRPIASVQQPLQTNSNCNDITMETVKSTSSVQRPSTSKTAVTTSPNIIIKKSANPIVTKVNNSKNSNETKPIAPKSLNAILSKETTPIELTEASNKITYKTDLTKTSESLKPIGTPSEQRFQRHSISSTSSSSGRSRSPSPPATDDPLALFRNVVHIQAPTVKTSTTENKPPSKKTRVAKKSTSGIIVNTPTKTYQKIQKGATGVTKLRLVDSLELTESGTFTSSQQTNSISNSNRKPTTFNSKNQTKSSTVSSKAETSSAVNKPRSNVSNSVIEFITARKKIPTNNKSKIHSTVKTTDKNEGSRGITINDIKKLIPSTSKPKVAPEAKRKSTPVATPDTKKIKHLNRFVGENGNNTISRGLAGGTSHQPAHVIMETTEPRKVMNISNDPMRLEDFSLDDIEDIIELE